jgi:hypothetical protein
MAVTYSLAPEPFWVIINNEGTVAGGAKMYTRSSLNLEQDKIVYQDAGGTIPWPNPIIFDLNGVQGPFYWEFDSASPEDLYYIFVNDSDGNLIWDINDFSGGSGGGGGGTVTTYLPLFNYIANNVFINHIDDMASAANLTNTVIAPSNHKGFTPALITPIVAAYGTVGPDIRFVKNDTSLLSDQITFPLFPLASAALAPDSTPVEYLRYQCSGSPIGETYKSFQFPITQKVKNLSGQAMTFNIWAKVTATPVTLNVNVVQYFGSGTSASVEASSTEGAITLTTSWVPYKTLITIPSVAGKSLGTGGQQTNDDALYIQLALPLGTNCDIQFTKPSLYLGNVNPDQTFDTYDEIDSINQTPRTGDIKTSLLSSAPYGWVAMNDGSIGETASGATNRANQDTFQLYKTIWDGVLDAWAPVSSGRGASAVADFVALKTLTLPRSLGRALAGAGAGAGLTARALGQYAGSEVITVASMPAHNHPGSTIAISTNSPGGSAGVYGSSGTNQFIALNTIASQGGGTLNVQGAADGNMEPTSFFNVFIKL